MRFYLDNDVDHACRDVLAARGHEVWTTSQAGRGRAADQDQAIYAADQHAILVTHDAQFATRQRERSFSPIVHLAVEQPDAPDVLSEWLEDIEPVLERREFVVVEVRRDGFQVRSGRWE